MPRQIITLEIEYNLFWDSHELRDPPSDWPIESALDHYADCEESNTETRMVRLLQSSPVVYTDTDEEQAQAAETTLLELGIFR